MKNNFSETISKVYELIGEHTPLICDCGIYCNGKCCKGDDKDGMLLFPGEKEYFENNDAYRVFFDERYNSFAVSCKGSCIRDQRPLSCRIFPYQFYYDKESERINVAPDIRAVDYCPLLKNNIKINKKFLRSLRISALKLQSDPDCLEYVVHISSILTDFHII